MARPKKSADGTTPPPTERLCQELQAKFLEPDCPQDVKDEFFLLMRTYARSLTLKEIKRKGIFLQPERVDEICTDATLAVMKQYQTPGWSIQASFAGIIRWKIIEAMYKPAKEEQTSSLNFKFSDDANSKEISDAIDSGAALPWHMAGGELPPPDDPAATIEYSVNIAYEEVEELLAEAYQMLPYETYMKFVPWLLLQIRKPKTRNIKSLFTKMFLSSREENAMDILLLEMRNRIAKHT